MKAKNEFALVYLRTRRRLHQQRGTLAALYGAAQTAGAQEGKNTSALLQASKEADQQTYVLGDAVISALAARIERLETDLHVRDIYAAAVVLVLDDTLGSAYAEFKACGGNPRQLSRLETAKVLDAGGNNFRHYEEWGRKAWTALSIKAKNNIVTIARFLDMPLDDEQKRHDGHRWFGQIIAWHILERLGPDSYQTVEIAVLACLEEMLIALALQEHALAINAHAVYD